MNRDSESLPRCRDISLFPAYCPLRSPVTPVTHPVWLGASIGQRHCISCHSCSIQSTVQQQQQLVDRSSTSGRGSWRWGLSRRAISQAVPARTARCSVERTASFHGSRANSKSPLIFLSLTPRALFTLVASCLRTTTSLIALNQSIVVVCHSSVCLVAFLPAALPDGCSDQGASLTTSFSVLTTYCAGLLATPIFLA